jgi:DNA-binding MarR family transcriptional regulator
MTGGRPVSAEEPRPGGTDATTTHRVVMALRRIIRTIDLHSRSLEHRFGLTGPQALVLREVQRREACPVGELARAAHLSQATITGIVDRLERKGMVRRTRSAEDKRRVLVTTTDQGTAVLAAAPPLLQDSFTAAFRSLPDGEQEEILAALERLVVLFEARGLSAGAVLATGPLDGAQPDPHQG